MSYDDFKEFTIDKINDATSCGNDNNISYSTIDRLKVSAAVASVTNIVSTNPSGKVSLSWDPPSDYDAKPENYLGFLVIRKFGTVAPTSPKDGTIVYLGRNTFFGDIPNLLNTEAIFSADGGFGFDELSYSVFTLGSSFTYSNPTSIKVTIISAPETVIASRFMDIKVDGNRIIDSNKLNFTMSNPELTSLSTVSGGPDIPGYGVIQLQGSNTVAPSIISDPITLPDIEPNTVYNILFWLRSNYCPDEVNNPKDSAVNAFSGIFEVISDNLNLYQHTQLLHNEDVNRTFCSCDDIDYRTPFYDFSNSLEYNYFGSAENGIFRRIGITIVTGDKKDSTPNNLYGSPTQKLRLSSGDNNTIQIKYSLPNIDKTTFGSNVSSVSADISAILVTKGTKIGLNKFPVVEKTTPLNLVLNNTLNFDTTTSSVSAPKDDGFNTDAQSAPACADWIINNGAFAYTKVHNYYYATLTATCDQSALLQQDIWYMAINANQDYTITFEAKLNPPNAQQKVCSQSGVMCPETSKGGGPGVENVLNIEILDSTKTSVGSFDGGKSVGPVKLSATDYYCGVGSPMPTTSNNCAYTSNCKNNTDWVPFSYDFQVKRSLSPSLKFSVYKDLAAGVTWGIRNIKITPKNPAEGIGIGGFDIPFPIPTVPSVISDNVTPKDYAQTWDFNTKPSPGGETILQWLSELNNAKENSDGRNVGGLFCLDQKGSTYENLSVVQDDNQQVLCLTAKANAPDPKKANVNSPNGAVLLTSEYYTSGVFDLWVKVTNVVDDKGNPVNNNDPVGCCFADWAFHYIDYSNTFNPKERLQPDPKRNAEIDIEIGANCPKSGTDYTYEVGRLNGWGGTAGGTGGNFEMHTQMPCDLRGNQIYLSDGEYHKLTIVLNTGTDNPKTTDRSNTRSPGYIKWYIDDILWGGGWLGANYGQDNIPHTAMRFVFGPWFPINWAGCMCPGDQTGSDCDFTICKNFIWDSADFYLKKASYTPLYSNGKKDQSNYMVPPAQDASGKPTTKEGPNPNRGMWLPASNPYVHFDPTCPNAPLMPSSIVKGISTQRKKTKGFDFDLDVDIDLDLDVDIDLDFDSNE